MHAHPRELVCHLRGSPVMRFCPCCKQVCIWMHQDICIKCKIDLERAVEKLLQEALTDE
jgi:hypothetical protein